MSNKRLEDTSLEIFNKVTLLELVAFILGCILTLTTTEIAKKGKLFLYIEKGEHTYILLGYEYCTIPNKLLQNLRS